MACRVTSRALGLSEAVPRPYQKLGWSGATLSNHPSIQNPSHFDVYSHSLQDIVNIYRGIGM